MYVRMVIGEAVSEEQLREFGSIYKEAVKPEVLKESGLVRSEMMFEEGGRMAIVMTTWKTREDCLRYHTSRAYRQFVVKTQHLLIGEFVVKLFQME